MEYQKWLPWAKKQTLVSAIVAQISTVCIFRRSDAALMRAEPERTRRLRIRSLAAPSLAVAIFAVFATLMAMPPEAQAQTASTDATLNALAIEGATGGEDILLNPVFDADTEAYTASVGNRIDAVTLTATTTDSNATVAITSDDDSSTQGEAELDLTVGSNTLTVTVTAEDTTTKTYTITVTRATAPPAPSDCPADTTWCTTMGVGYAYAGADSLVQQETWGYLGSGSYGDLDSTTFSQGGTPYSVSSVLRYKVSTLAGNTISDTLNVAASPALPDGTVLQLGSRTFTVDADSAGETVGRERWYIQTDPMIWAAGQNVTVSLRFPSVPGAPTSLTAAASSESQIDLSWMAPADNGGAAITGYRIEVSADDGTSWSDLVANTGATTYSHTGLAAGNTRHYRVSAINSSGTGPVSDEAGATTSSVLVSNAGRQVHSSGATVDNLEDDSYLQAQRFTTGDNALGYTLSSVRLYFRDNVSTPAPRVSIYEADASGGPGSSRYTLTNPSQIASVGSNTFTAPANATLEAETQYFVVVEATSGSFVIDVTASNAEDSGGANGWSINNQRHLRFPGSGTWASTTVSHSLRISVIGDVIITVPDAPTDLTATASGESQIDLSWAAPADNGGAAITGYKIEVSADDGTSWSDLVANTGATTTYSHTGLAAGNTRHYRVSAINFSGTGPASDEAGDTTPSVLVRNTGQTQGTDDIRTVGNSGSSTYTQAQGFTTGDNVGGYTLLSVQLYVTQTGITTPAAIVSIYEADASGNADSSRYTLTNPRRIRNQRLNTFTAPANATLEAGTTYFVVVEATSGAYGVSATASNAEDSDGENGWSIDNQRHYRTSNAGNWTTTSAGDSNVRISVNGTAKRPWDDQTVYDATVQRTSEIANPGDTVWYSLPNIEQDGLYRLRYFDTVSPGDPGYGRLIVRRPKMQVYNSDGSPVIQHGFEVADELPQRRSRLYGLPEFVFMPQADGTYYMSVSSLSNDVGEFKIRYKDRSLGSPYSDRSGDTINADCRAGANTRCKMKVPGANVEGNLTWRDVDRYKFAVRKGGDTEICTEFLADPIHGEFQISSPITAWVPFAATEAGTYCTEFDPNHTGMHEIRITSFDPMSVTTDQETEYRNHAGISYTINFSRE